MWIFSAIGSAFFAGLTSILAKCGIRKTDSDIATAIRTGVVLVFSWIMVFVSGSFGTIFEISPKSFLFLALSGIATGASWICYFKALSMGDVNKVVPIDKSSTVLTVILAIIFFGETENLLIKLVCTAVLACGILMMVEKKDYYGESKKGWMLYAVLSAVFAAATSILAKIGIDGVESNLGTALRTIIVLAMAWAIVFMKGKQKEIKSIDKRELGFIDGNNNAYNAVLDCIIIAKPGSTGCNSGKADEPKFPFIDGFYFFLLAFHKNNRPGHCQNNNCPEGGSKVGFDTFNADFRKN